MKKHSYIYPYSYFRILMILPVVMIHWQLFLPEGFSFPELIGNYREFCIAFFFLLSGFLTMRNSAGKDRKGWSYKEEVINILRKKQPYLIKYEIAILLSLAYYLLVHKMTGQFSLPEIFGSAVTDLLFVSTLINPDSLTMNTGWFFQCLVQFWVISPLILKGWKTLKEKLAAKPALYGILLVLFQIGYILFYYSVSEMTDPFYNSFVRIYEIMVGMSVYEMTALIPIENRTGVTMLEGLGAALLFYPLYRIPALDILFSYHIVSNLFCMIILFSYAYGTGLFTAWIFRKNEFVEYLAKHVLDVFLFHFTIFHYASLSPKLSSPYLLLAEGIVLSCFIGVLIDRILEIRAGQKRTA